MELNLEEKLTKNVTSKLKNKEILGYKWRIFHTCQPPPLATMFT